MADELSPPTGEIPLQPVSLTPEQKELCGRLDELYEQCGLQAQPSDMFQGALFASREYQNNPDWLAQAAHSLREILYHLNTEKFLKKYDLGKIYGTLSNLAHHDIKRNSDFSNYKISDFESLKDEFETSMRRALRQALTRHIDVQNQIDPFLSSDPSQIISDRPTR